jgi:hypothetical protein
LPLGCDLVVLRDSELNAHFGRSRQFEVTGWLYRVVERLAMSGQVAPVIFAHETR